MAQEGADDEPLIGQPLGRAKGGEHVRLLLGQAELLPGPGRFLLHQGGEIVRRGAVVCAVCGLVLLVRVCYHRDSLSFQIDRCKRSVARASALRWGVAVVEPDYSPCVSRSLLAPLSFFVAGSSSSHSKKASRGIRQ